MDRNTEVKMQYEDALSMIERFKQREQLKVEGEWYLVERDTLQQPECWIMTQKEIETYAKYGFKFTPVKIFREGRTENGEDNA